MYLDRLFKLMAEKQASDLFISCGAPINIKINGVVAPVSTSIRWFVSGVTTPLIFMLSGAPHEMKRSDACFSAISLNSRSRYIRDASGLQ